MMTDLDGSAVEAAAARVRDHGCEVEAVELDVRDPDAVERVAHFAVDRFAVDRFAVDRFGAGPVSK